MKYYLMHKNIQVAALDIDEITGVIINAVITNSDHLPLRTYLSNSELKKWWNERAVPITQKGMREYLLNKGIQPVSYLTQNLGLSLTDCYWICPTDKNFSWEEINLYRNTFKEANQIISETSNQEAIYSPSGSLHGDLQKQWVIINNLRYLIKDGARESMNEVLASKLHEEQGLFPAVNYSLFQLEDNYGCISKNFTSEDLEFVPGIDIIMSEKKRNDTSYYEHFINICEKNGIDVRPFMEYQIAADFILTNTDRHLENFGILRNPDTGVFVGMAPIYDNGNSMFCEKKYIKEKATEIKVNSFQKDEEGLLKYLQKRDWIQTEKLPSIPFIENLYSHDEKFEIYRDNMIDGYLRKQELYHDFIQGIPFKHKYSKSYSFNDLER